MIVLGLACDIWIASATLLIDGKVIAAAPEERFNRQKMSKVFPHRAIDYCLSEAGIGIGDVDHIAFGWNPARHLKNVSSRYTDNPRWRGEYLYMLPGALMTQFGAPSVSEIHQSFDTDTWSARTVFVDHHMCHAASTYFLSGFNEAAVLTLDGRGEEDTCTRNMAHGNSIKSLGGVKMPHSLGLFYSAITEFLGFRPHTDEWKVMALGSSGRTTDNPWTDKIRSLISLQDDGGFEQDLTYFSYYMFDQQPHMYSDKMTGLLGAPRSPDGEYTERDIDIAAALQLVFEECVTHVLTKLQLQTGSKNLALAGGAAMNSVYNGKITKLTAFENVFIPSCPDDSGVSLGAALYANYCIEKDDSPTSLQVHNYWGPAYDDDEISAALDQAKIPFTRSKNIASETAKLLADGKLVGWVQGRMEFGQRSLGNRSILADPRRAEMKDIVNAAVKFRESFRPFAPAILVDRVSEYFDLPEGAEVPFMERVYPFRENTREKVPAVVHTDGTGRLQTVTREANARFFELISAFDELTGVPIILNTSFNLNGEPIVCTPQDAIRTFYSCGLDALVLGNHLIMKHPS